MGHGVVYKSKSHMSSRVASADGTTYIEDDLSRYGFQEWGAPDAGGDTKPENFGGATDATAPDTKKNDQRFVNDAVSWLTERLSHNTGPMPFASHTRW